MYRDAFEYMPFPLVDPPPDVEPPAVTPDQIDAVSRVLQVACSDSRFAEKAMKAITQILSFTPVAPPEP